MPEEFNEAQPANNEPPEASAGAPAGVPSMAPTGAGPAPGPAAPQPAPEPAPGSFFKHLSHSFAGAILGGLSGGDEKVTGYEVDPASGKMTAKMAPKTAGDRVRSIIQASMAGLAAGSNAPDRPGAQALSGFGAGFTGVQAQNAAQDQKLREQAKEENSRRTANELHQANIAHSNALTYSLWQHSAQEGIDHDPERKMYQGIVDSAQAAGIPIRFVNGDEVQQMAQADPNFLKTHMALPLGSSPLMQDGKPVTNPDGTPKMVGKIALIDAKEGTNIQLPSPLVSDIQKYGKDAGFSEDDIKKLTSDLSMPVQQFTSLFGKIQEAKKKALEAKPELILHDKKPMMRNPISGEMKELTEQQRFDYEKEQVSLEKIKAEIPKIKAETAAKEVELANLKKFGVNIPADYVANPNVFNMSPEAIQQDMISKKVQVPPNFAALYGAAHYDVDPASFPTILRKGTGQMDRQTAVAFIRNFINPNYDDKNYKAVQKLESEFASTRQQTAGGNLIAFNTATGHLGQLYDAALALQNSNVPALNDIANRYGVATGKSAPVVFDSIRNALVGELGKTFKGASPDIPEAERILQGISNAQSPQQALDVAKANAHLMLTKAGAQVSHYYGYTGKIPPTTLSPASRAVYQRLGIDVNEIIPKGAQLQNTANLNPQGGQPSKGVFNSAKWAAANPGKDVEAAKAQAQAEGFEVK